MSVNIIFWIVFGALVGWVANANMKRNSQMGAVGNIFIGIAGATIGGFLMIPTGAGSASGFNLYNLLVAIWGGGDIALFDRPDAKRGYSLKRARRNIKT